MTEIEFLVSLLLTDISNDVKERIVKRIGEVERDRNAINLTTPQLQYSPYYNNVTVPAVLCQHEYPNPWNSITPPVCKKCGMPAYNLTITSTSGSVSCC